MSYVPPPPPFFDLQIEGMAYHIVSVDGKKLCSCPYCRQYSEIGKSCEHCGAPLPVKLGGADERQDM